MHALGEVDVTQMTPASGFRSEAIAIVITAVLLALGRPSWLKQNVCYI